MIPNRESGLPLNGFRVLDLADEKADFCSKLLADLGAMVAQIERPSSTDTTQNQDLDGQCHCDPDDDEHGRMAFNENKMKSWAVGKFGDKGVVIRGFTISLVLGLTTGDLSEKVLSEVFLDRVWKIKFIEEQKK